MALPEKELLSLLTSRIDSLRESQLSAQARYQDAIQQLRGELVRCNQEYDLQRQEFDRLRTDISSTKKDIASLIHMVQRKGASDEADKTEPKLQKRHSPGSSSPRSVLNGFIKIVPAARQ